MVLADQSSPPAFRAALLDSRNSFCRAGSREDRGRWFSMYAVTGSDSNASMSVEVAGDIDQADVDRWTCTGRRGFDVEGCVIIAGAVVDILQARSCDDCRGAVLWRADGRRVLRLL